MSTNDFETLKQQAEHFFQQGLVAWEVGDRRAALNDWAQALAAYNELIGAGLGQFRADAARTRMNLGNALQRAGRFDEAVGHFKQALLTYVELIKAGQEQFRAEAAKSTMSLGEALTNAGRLKEALEYLEQALSAYGELIGTGHRQCRAEAADTRTILGIVLAEMGRLSDAVKHFEQALSVYGELIGSGYGQCCAKAANARMNLGSTLANAGRLDEAVRHFEQALSAYVELIRAGHGQFRANAADTRMNLGGGLLSAGRLNEAVGHFEQALSAYGELIAAGHSQFRAKVAHALGKLGSAKSKTGRLDEAVGYLEQALSAYVELIEAGNEQFRADAAGIRMRLGNALVNAGCLDEAVGHFSQALSAYVELIGGGYEQFHADAADTRVNLGIALVNAGRFDEAVGYFEQALSAYLELIRAGHEQLRASAASTRMNLGVALTGASRLDEGVGFFEQALAAYAELIGAGYEQFRAVAARTKMNLGIALMSAGRLNEAVGHFEQALAAYDELITAGHGQFRADAARTRASLGTAMQSAGRFDEAVGCFEQALSQYLALVEVSGQWQYLEEMMNVASNLTRLELNRLNNALVVSTQEQRGTTQLARLLERAIARLTTQIDWLTNLDPKADQLRVSTLYHTFKTLELWDLLQDMWPDSPSVLTDSIMQLIVRWLEAMCHFLNEGHPRFVVACYEKGIAPLLNDMLGLLAKHGWTQLLGTWYLATQGLRGQRQAQLDALRDDPDIVRLLALQQQLDNLANEMGGTALFKEEPQEVLEPSNAFAGARSTNVMQILLDRYERIFREEFEPLKQDLIAQGKYPEKLNLDISHVRERLQAHAMPAVVMMLIPLECDGQRQLLVLRIGGRPDEDRLWRVPLGDTLHRVADNWRTLRQCADFAALHGRGTGSGSWRGGVFGEEGAALAAVDDSALARGAKVLSNDEQWVLLDECLAFPDLLRPYLQTCWDEGVRQVYVLPSGDCHLPPWAARLDQALTGLAVRQFPSAAAWWRGTEPLESENECTVDRWASLAHDAAGSDKALLWVEPEAVAISRLWQAGASRERTVRLRPDIPEWPLPQGADRQAAPELVSNLCCIGHGDARGGNLAMAGMMLPKPGGRADEFSVFTAMRLHQIRHAQRLIMSCCALGRIEEAQGEALGMTALAFNFKTRVAVGAMLPIPDLEGSLFFMALHFAWSRMMRCGSAETGKSRWARILQYAWSRSEQTGSPAEHKTEWAKVFHATRRTILAGEWPEGYGAWLQTEWGGIVEALSDSLADQRRIWLDCRDPRDGLEGALRTLASKPDERVRWVAAVTTCLG